MENEKRIGRSRSRLGNFYYAAGVDDPGRFRTALREAESCLGPTGGFSGDNLLTWGRNLSFALDKRFMQAFNGASPDGKEKGLIWRVYVLYWAAMRGLELDGDFVEAACYKGFSARVVADAVGLKDSAKRYWLYDRFDQPAPDGAVNYRHDETLRQAVTARFADLPNVHVVAGEIPTVFNDASPTRVSFLHIDLNDAKAEVATLEHLYDRMTPGGVIVFDDYGWSMYRPQKDAEDEWLARRGKLILELPTGQGLLIK